MSHNQDHSPGATRNKPEARITELARRVWLKANSMDEPLHIDFATTADATKFRFALYEALKKAKRNPGSDPELLAAGDECSASLRGTRLSVARSTCTPAFQTVSAALEALGDAEAPQVGSPLDRAAAESLARIQALLATQPQGD